MDETGGDASFADLFHVFFISYISVYIYTYIYMGMGQNLGT